MYVWVFLLKLTGVCVLFDEFQVASNPKPLRSSEDIEFEHYKAMRRNESPRHHI